MSRRLRYQVAVSLDGFLARRDGSYDWIVDDAAIDLEALFKEFDTVVMGRKTHEIMTAQGGTGAMPGAEVLVFSRTLPPSASEGLRITDDDPAKVVAALKRQPGRDIWLFGGGSLFRTLLAARLVDTVELAVMPVLLGDGIPLLPPGVEAKLVLTDHRVLPQSGIAVLAYQVEGTSGAARIRFVRAARGANTRRRAPARRKKTVEPRTRRTQGGRTSSRRAHTGGRRKRRGGR